MAAKANFVLEILIVKTFPKGSHLFGGGGKQAGTNTITNLQFKQARNAPPAYVTNSSGRR